MYGILIHWFNIPYNNDFFLILEVPFHPYNLPVLIFFSPSFHFLFLFNIPDRAVLCMIL